jgi:spore maturation protein SpmA
MRRTVPAAVTLLSLASLAVFASGCGFMKKSDLSSLVEYHFEVTGGTAEHVSYSVPQQQAPNGAVTADVSNPALPWKNAGVANAGVITLQVMPTSGAATCRIVIEKKEVAKKQGQPGAPLTCTAKVKGDEG